MPFTLSLSDSKGCGSTTSERGKERERELYSFSQTVTSRILCAMKTLFKLMVINCYLRPEDASMPFRNPAACTYLAKTIISLYVGAWIVDLPSFSFTASTSTRLIAHRALFSFTILRMSQQDGVGVYNLYVLSPNASTVSISLPPTALVDDLRQQLSERLGRLGPLDCSVNLYKVRYLITLKYRVY